MSEKSLCRISFHAPCGAKLASRDRTVGSAMPSRPSILVCV